MCRYNTERDTWTDCNNCVCNQSGKPHSWQTNANGSKTCASYGATD
jgi:hypothetical protein